jgi:phosphoribosylanthranilate isomerase
MAVVKICGVMDGDTALAALEAGADMLGFVLAPSRRQLPPEAAAEIVQVARRRFPPAERPWLAVGVFANQPLEFVRSAAVLAALDVVQLSGQEPPEYCRAVDATVYKTLHMGNEADLTTKTPRHQDSQSPLVSWCLGGSVLDFREEHGAERVVLDSGGAGQWGGTGRPFRWELAGDAARACLVAGGLSPGNVAEALALLRPWGVDVSSGVETDGRKDPARIRAFINAVRRSDDHECEE